MKHQNAAPAQNQKTAGPARSAVATDPDQDAIDFAPEPDEVARRAYFCYVNQGSRPGQHVQHWLAAEEELISERNRTRVHGFHNRS